jgi:hypothetical protein
MKSLVMAILDSKVMQMITSALRSSKIIRPKELPGSVCGMTAWFGRADSRAVDTKFRLVHYITGCVLFSHKVKVSDLLISGLMISYPNGALVNKK